MITNAHRSIHSRLRRRGLAGLTVAGLALAACGGGSDSSSDDTGDVADTADTTADTEPTTDTDSPVDGEPVDTAAPAVDETSGGTYEPGAAEFRAVNALDRPVDIYVRTTGLVEAFPIQAGLEPGEVSEFVAPPEGGSFVVTEAGAGDPTCVSTCDHFVTNLSASFPEHGLTYTAILHEDAFSERTSAFDLWEAPDPGLGSANAMPAPDPSAALGVITAIAVTDADFGLRLAINGVEGCVEPVGGGNVLIGGNQTPAFALESASSFTLHDQPDRECSDAPVGGPFEFAGSPGSRNHIILTGSPGALDAIVLPMVGDVAAAPPSADAGDRDAAVGFVTAEFGTEFGLVGEQATCAAELLVDAVGADVLLVDGELVDLDLLGDDVAEQAGGALVQSVDVCGIDPSVYGG